ncbi:MAG: ABC transporter permease [Dehalococcoidia bacterium]|nr:ABC transporter permease [Dehalococcoidia bacterium]
MTRVILGLSLRQLVAQRRTLLLVLLAALPVALAVLFRVTGGSLEENPDFAAGIMAHFIVALVLPLTALVVGTAALGQELEDGTIVYLVAKPLPRWQVVLAKIGAAWIVTATLIASSVLLVGLVLFVGQEGASQVPAFMVAVVLGALGYTALFVALSIRFSRALIIGLAYVFVWESLLSQFIAGVRFLSVGSYTVSIADALADSPSRLVDGALSGVNAAVLLAALTALATWYAMRRLAAYQISERV